MDMDLSKSKDKPVHQKKKLDPIVILPVLPPKRTADSPNKPLYIKRNWSEYKELWEKVNKKT